jgi:16S rRNA (guanine966-N2)-methyltransferase
MRIISGELKGRTFDSPANIHTHPMSEKMRGALFNILGDITDLIVFDAYGGSGALAFEAISRGARSALVCESNKSVARTILANIKELAIAERVRLVIANSASWSQNNISAKFDLVICDPPYNDIKIEQLSLIAHTVKDKGLFILSLPPIYPRPQYTGLQLEKDTVYGDGSLVFYRKI